ncbi:MAG: 50S ribosomal protein L24 [Methanobacteriaceae archaeon]
MSKQPRKQRKALYTAPLHARRKTMSVTLSKDLKEEFNTRSLPVKAGDKVKVTRGEFKDHEGKVESVNIKKYKVTVEGVTLTKVDGTSSFLPIDPSNLMLIDVDLKDDKRNKIIERRE